LAEKLRVHTLSKDLGVTSKAILEKCKVECVEGVTNHMSTVSAGLAETIRQWFSEDGQSHSAVETAAPVDLKKVRKKTTRKRTKKKKAEEKDEAATATATIEAPPEAEEKPEKTEPAEPDKQKAAPAVTTAEPGVQPAVITGELPPAVEAPPTEAPVEEAEPLAPAAKAPKTRAHPKKEKKKKKKEKVLPAGPQNVPAPAQMKGPQVVGFAKPDPVMRPPARPPTPRAPTPTPEQPETPGRGVKRGPGDRDYGDRRRRSRFNPRRSSSSLSDSGEMLKEWNEQDLIEREERLRSATGRGVHARRARDQAGVAPGHIAPRKTHAQVSEPIIAHELCAATGIGLNQLFYKFRDHNIVLTRNTVVPTDVAEVVLLEFGVELEAVKPKTAFEKLQEQYGALERKKLKPRPPVVTMLGHVDHGKTSLLDMIRRTSVATGEAGGITQHIGAYRVEKGDLSVTFLDTPGHEAFTAMRARGAHMTDVVVLLVAADDGVMPQTIEAINHAKAAETHIVVALNKIDLPGVDLNKVYGQLAEYELAPAEWGGETDVIKTSATTGEGVEELVAHLATLSELLDLKADPTIPASGTVVEAEMRKGMGPLAKVLIREGTLRKGDFVVCGTGAGRVRFLKDDKGKQVKAATPGTPVEVAGLDEVPRAGDMLYSVKSLQEAKQFAEEMQEIRRAETLQRTQRKPTTLADLLKTRKEDEIPELNIILKADVQGSIDALLKTLSDIPSEEVNLKFLHTGIGSVTESDVVLAEASGALIVGFNIIAESGAQKLAQSEGVDIRLYRVIYNLIDDIRAALEGLLPTIKNEKDHGKAEVREIFNVSKVGTIAGCVVSEGFVGRTHYVRVVRDGQIIVPTEEDVKRVRHRTIASLRRFKDDAKEVRAGMECGIRVENFDDVKPGDILEVYEITETAQTL